MLTWIDSVQLFRLCKLHAILCGASGYGSKSCENFQLNYLTSSLTDCNATVINIFHERYPGASRCISHGINHYIGKSVDFDFYWCNGISSFNLLKICNFFCARCIYAISMWQRKRILGILLCFVIASSDIKCISSFKDAHMLSWSRCT